MVKMKVVREGNATILEAPEGMMTATDEQVISHAAETLRVTMPIDEFCVERTSEGLLVHPKATYG